MTTVRPLKNTARLEVAPARPIAPSWSRPALSLLAKTGDDEERVVDPDREAHHHEHVHDEEGELPDLPDERCQPERDDDRDDRDGERHERRDERAEDEEQDDQSRGQAKHLAANQVLLGRCFEVQVDDPLPGGGDFVARFLVERADGLDESLDVPVGGDTEIELDQRSAPVLRNQRAVVPHGVERVRGRNRVQPTRDILYRSGQVTTLRDVNDDGDVGVEVASLLTERHVGDLFGPSRLRPVREVVVGRERRAEQHRDRRRRRRGTRPARRRA